MRGSDIPIALILTFVPEEEITSFKSRLVGLGFLERRSQVGMVMARAKDCFDTEFFLGEILVAESYVEYHGNLGYGMIIGDSIDKAFIVAAYDAVEDDEALRPIKAMIDNWIIQNSKYYLDSIRDEDRLFRSTRVRFEMMDGG